MNKRISIRASVVALGAVLCAAVQAVAAEPYPSRTVTLVVPYPAGGTIDHLARDFAEHLRARWGKAVVVDNRGGGNGIIGVEYARRGNPDGYTLLVGGGSTHTVGPATDPEMKYDPIRDFSPIAYFGETPMVLTAGPSLAGLNFKQVVEKSKSKPGGLTYGSVGTSTLLAARMLFNATGAQLIQVNYKQFGPALLDISRGDVDMGISSLSIVQGNLKQQMLRPLAVTSKERSKLLPDVPSVAEHHAGFEVLIWFGLFGPAGLPEDIKTKLNNEVAAFQQAPGRAEKWGAEALTLRPRAVGEFADYLKSDYAKWRALAVEAGLRSTK